MKKCLNILYKYLPILLMIFWICFTLSSPYMQQFNTDEAWAYDIAADLNFFEIIKMMHYEGHAFLWYLVLKPFTYFESLYPYVLKYINWIFCFGAMGLLWKFAPFNNFEKLLITISSPFLIIYPSMGRCYGLAIFLLFVITVIYKNRLKYPIWYAILLFLATNTCINNAFATFILGVFFIYDLYKANNLSWKNKKFLVPAAIVCFGFLMLVIQWIPIHTPKYMAYFGRFYWFREFFASKGTSNIYKLASFLTFFPIMLSMLYFNIKEVSNKRWFIFGFFTVNVLILFNLFISVGRNYHYFFLYIYLLMTYWLLIDNNQEFRLSKYAYKSFSIFIISVSIVFNAWFVPTKFWFQKFDDLNMEVSQIKSYIPKNSKMFIVLDLSQDIIPYLKKDYDLITLSRVKVPSYDAYRKIYSEKYYNPQDLKINKNESIYYLISERYLKQYNRIIKLETYPDNCININKLYIVCKLDNKQFNLKLQDKNNKKLNYKDIYSKNISQSTIIKSVSKIKLPDIDKSKNFDPKTQSMINDKNKLKKIESNRSNIAKIELLAPIYSTILVAMEHDSSILKELNYKYKLKDVKGNKINPFIKYSDKGDFIYPQSKLITKIVSDNDTYFLTSYKYMKKHDYRIIIMPESCIAINKKYLLCKLPIKEQFKKNKIKILK